MNINNLREGAPNILDSLDFLDLFAEDSVDAVFYDPQYCAVHNHHRTKDIKKRKKALFNTVSTDHIEKCLFEIRRVLKPSSYLFFWWHKATFLEVIKFFKRYEDFNTFKIVDFIVWNKRVLGLGQRSRRACEFLLICQKGPYRLNWIDKSIPDVWSERVDSELVTEVHPHTKPHRLQERLIKSVTTKGGLIIDPAAGGYSVLHACRSVGDRRFYGVDLNWPRGFAKP